MPSLLSGFITIFGGVHIISTVREWPIEFGLYVPEYQPCFGERRVSTRANQELKPLPVPKLVEGNEVCVATKKRAARSISVIRDFPPILGRFNPYLSDERK
jgi:hypothetical protein